MLRNDTIQAGLITKLKSLTAVTAEVTTSEIRESQYQGTEFIYPNVRLDLLPTIPSIEGCSYADISFYVRVFSEGASSQECDRIAGKVAQGLHSVSFTENDVYFSGVRVRSIGSALRVSNRVWQANVQVTAIVSG